MLSEIFYFPFQHFYMLNRMDIWMGKRAAFPETQPHHPHKAHFEIIKEQNIDETDSDFFTWHVVMVFSLAACGGKG